MRHPENKPEPQPIDVFRPFDKDGERVAALRPLAKRFIFDREASSYLGHFIAECNELIIANRQFAIPPFPVTYIQIEMDEMIEGIGRGQRQGDNTNFSYDSRDKQVGYLIDNKRVFTVSQNEGGANLSLFRYEMDTPSPAGPIFHEPTILNDPDDEWARAVLLMGTTVHSLPSEEAWIDIIRSVKIKVDPRADHVSRSQRRDNILSSAGDIRNIWAALLLINQKRSFVTLRDVPWRAALYKGKRKVFGAHSVVTIKLTGKQTIAGAMRPMLHAPRAAHDVKAHFYHSNCKEGCIHEWPMMPDMDGPPDSQGRPAARWQCLRCGGRRTHKKAYTTGSAAVGFTTTEYRVKK